MTILHFSNSYYRYNVLHLSLFFSYPLYDIFDLLSCGFLQRDAIQELSPEKLAALLDSDDVSRDPSSLSKILHKLDLEQFKDALKILTDKMVFILLKLATQEVSVKYNIYIIQNETGGEKWRPPISIQDVVASSYFRFDHGDEADTMDSFLKYMCPFAGGVDSWQIGRLASEASYIEPM